MSELILKEYTTHLGSGWALQSDNEPTTFYFHKNTNELMYELYHGNGFFVARSQNLEKMSELTMQLYREYPYMLFSEEGERYNNEDHRGMQNVAKKFNFDTTFVFDL